MIINGKEYTRANLGKIFDYAMLKPEATRADIEEHIRLSKEYNVNGIYCNPYWVPLIADALEGTDIETGLCPSFPMGANSLSIKLKELEEMCKIVNGRPAAIDFVVNLGALKGKDYDVFRQEVREICQMGHSYGYPCKAIFENGLLTHEEIAIGCRMAAEEGVDWVKCATGRAAVAPQMETVKIMRANIPDHVKIKFAGFGTYCLAQLTIMGLASGVELFGNGFAHTIIDEIEKYYMDMVITTK